MYSKKAAPLLILKILKRDTNLNASPDVLKDIDRWPKPYITVSQLQKKLAAEYDMQLDAKTILSNLRILQEVDDRVCTGETFARGQEGQENDITKGWYYEPLMSDGELHLLFDQVAYSKALNRKQRSSLEKHMEELIGARFAHITYSAADNANPYFLYNLEILQEAIAKNRQISFDFVVYNLEKKLEKAGETRQVSPYQVVVHRGIHYLLCGHARSEKIYSYRLDKIANIKLLADCYAKKHPENLQNYIKERVYLFSGGVEQVTFRTKKDMANIIIDQFGADAVSFLYSPSHHSSYDENSMLVSLKTGTKAFEKWAVQYCAEIEVCSPIWIRESVAHVLTQAAEKYNKKAK